MTLVLINYCALFLSMVLPVLVLGLVRVPGWPTSAALFVSLALVLIVAFVLKTFHGEDGRIAHAKHVQNQKWILLLFAVGGIVTSTRQFLYYEQFRLQIDLGGPLVGAAAILWALAAFGIVRGLGRWFKENRRRPMAVAKT